MSAELMRIAGALGTIRGATILPAVADQLRASARVGTVHYSTLIEGNELPIVEAERAAQGELHTTSRAKVELVNYVDALDVIDKRLQTDDLELTPELLLDLHRAATRGLGREDDPHFKPHHEGAWRDGRAVVVDELAGAVMHEGPPAEEVPDRIDGMLEWARRRLDVGDPAFVVAGVLHYGVTDIHPFADGNGRAARLMQVALLIHADVLPGRMFSFERYYAEDREAYYAALRSVRNRTFNMDSWLEYFLRGLAEEYERGAATVADLSALMPGGLSPVQLTAGQERGLTRLRLQGRREFTRREFEDAAKIGRSAATEGLRALVQHGVLQTRGSGPNTRYAFPGPVSATGARRGRPPTWTDERIARELRGFLADHDGWPSPDAFRAAGRGDLYSAAARAGGIARWRQMLGR
jgi:Fic family protein